MKENLALRILALVLAIILWAYVRVTTGGIAENSITQLTLELPIERRGVPTNLVPYEFSDETVRVTLQGRSEIVENLREGLVRAHVDLTNMVAGSHWPEVEVLPPREVQLIEQQPRSINVKLSPLFAKQVPVEIAVEGPAAAGMVAGDPQVEPREVKVQGPEAVVKDIVKVRGQIHLSKESQTFTATVAALAPVSEAGTPPGGSHQLRIVPKKCTVTVPIVAADRVVGLPVLHDKVRYTPDPRYSYSFEIDPAIVGVRVSEGVKPPPYLKTESVDFGSTSSIVEEEVKVEFPAGLSAAGVDTVRVRMIPKLIPKPNNVGQEATAPSDSGGES